MVGDASPVGLTRQDLPATCRSAADLSARGQRRTKALVRIELLALIGAGLAGLQPLRVGAAGLDVLAAVAAVLFLLSVCSMAYRGLAQPEQAWYSGRAGAESIRTLAWRYAVGGAPYPTTMSDQAAADGFLDRLAELLDQLTELQLAPAGAHERELTEAMRRLRAAPLAVRRSVYRRDRVENQITWYTQKANDHDRRATTWLAASVVASMVGVTAAVLRMLGVINVDLLGVAAACASAAIAWNQLSQNRNLVSAYRVAARELSIIRDRLDGVADEDWATFVSDAEDAVSREHTLWLARRGHLGVRLR
jgi:hypothetical protein